MLHILQTHPRPRSVLWAGVAHGWCTDFYLVDDDMDHGSNAFLEVLTRVLDHVHRICQVTGGRCPRHLIVMTDNTVSQAKNQYAMTFAGLLVARRKFSTISMNFLMVGHTHEDVDQLFAMFCMLVLRKHRFHSPAELAQHLRAELGPYAEGRGE